MQYSLRSSSVTALGGLMARGCAYARAGTRARDRHATISKVSKRIGALVLHLPSNGAATASLIRGALNTERAAPAAQEAIAASTIPGPCTSCVPFVGRAPLAQPSSSKRRHREVAPWNRDLRRPPPTPTG